MLLTRILVPEASTCIIYWNCTAGLYALKVYAKSRGADGSLLNVYNYVIKVATPMEHCEQFPGVSGAWSGGVDNELIEPRNGTLVAKQTVEFVAKIPEGNLYRPVQNTT